jgi:hypothetical protein
MGPRFFLPPSYVILSELIYALIIIIFCFIIYFKTKEIFELTKHKGIGFFRNTFLFFALSYFLRFLGILFIFYRSFVHIRLRELFFRPNMIMYPLITYFSYAAILSLVFSSFWKIKKTKFEWNILIHALAIFSTLIVFLTGSSNILIGFQFLLFIAAIILININPEKNKKKNAFSTLHIIYYLLFVFWVLNLISFQRGSLSFILNSVLNLFSILIFYIITHRVVKRLSINAKKKG